MQIVGHRGARGLAPENTIAGFKTAIASGVDAIECDVRITKDGVAVLHHDPAIGLAGKAALVIADTNLSTLRNAAPDLATLEGAIRVIHGTVPLHVEVKPGVPTQPIIQVVQMCYDNGLPHDAILFASKDQRRLLALQHAFPDVGLIVLEKWNSLQAMRRARQLGSRQICMNQRVLPVLIIKALQARGYQLSSYTVNSLPQAKRFKRAGLTAIVTDYPDRFTSL
jgi:glycerophosphoryl diester phosphodiesterase